MGKGSKRRDSPNFETNFKKVKFTANWEFRHYFRHLDCLVSGCHLPTDPHHVKTRGAGGRDESNLVPLCRVHHSECHQIGRKTFSKKYNLDLIASAGRIYEDFQNSQ